MKRLFQTIRRKRQERRIKAHCDSAEALYKSALRSHNIARDRRDTRAMHATQKRTQHALHALMAAEQGRL